MGGGFDNDTAVEKLTIFAVMQRSELLISYSKWLSDKFDECNFLDEINVDDYIKEINSL
jgi:hypothetical protein